MAEYKDVIQQFKRMCRYYNGSMDGCPLYCKGHGCNISHCRMLAFEDKKFATVVMKWAKENPVYPSWGEWLQKLYNNTNYAGIFITPIPADIAQKLGIEPIYDCEVQRDGQDR